jgi:amino acid adenylation domain-containing protein
VVDNSETCAALISRVHHKLVEMKNYEGLSVLEIASIHNKQLSFGNPFFDMIFNYLDYHTFQSMEADPAAAESTAPAVNITNYGRTNTHFDFSINVTGGNYVMGLRLTKKLRCGFSAEKAGRLYFRILEYFIGSSQQDLGGMDFVSGDEKRRLLHGFNDTKLDFGADGTLVGLFHEQVLKTPDATALVTAGASYTYRQLNECANQFASYLGENYHVRTDERVGILLERSEWMVIALLGVLKSGAAYVPMDTEYPQERIDYLVRTSQCRVVIDEKELRKFLAVQDSYSGKNPVQQPRPGNLSYVIYTSGSTGQPKGVMIEHRNAHAFIQWCRREFDETRYDLVLAVTSICFDLSIFEIFYPLSIGKKIRVLPSALAIPEYLNTGERLLLNTVPSVIGALLAAKADLGSVTILNMAGEPIPRKYISQLDCERMEVRNLYGPSEYTTYTTNYRITSDASILIGQPIANTQVYIVSENMHLQPIGVAGEIVIGGVGLARGYLNDAALTASKFIAHPFNEGERAYKTGDLGRWLPDGNIEFIGRKDDQVKVRGYRIELGEIEWAVQGYAGIEAAVVVARPNREGEKELVAYTVSAQPLNTHDLRVFLGTRLPAYMIPAHYVQLQALPLTPNGKVDRRRLPDPIALDMETGVEYVEPRNETEEMLVEIWKEILGREKIGVKDNFFELGGHSLKAMKLLAKIHKKFDVKLKLEEMFTKTTIEDMGREITRETWARKEKHTYSNDLSDQNFIL